uniref:Uncharacterized protein n=1 Tax=Ixodes ricinus TaxID=34613 RepID=A0A6B0UNF7_IXORI
MLHKLNMAYVNFKMIHSALGCCSCLLGYKCRLKFLVHCFNNCFPQRHFLLGNLLYLLHLLSDILHPPLEVVFRRRDVLFNVITSPDVDCYLVHIRKLAWNIHGACQRNKYFFSFIRGPQLFQ